MQGQFNRLIFPHEGKKGYVKALDGLRGLAVLIVLLSHGSNAGLNFHEYLDFSKIGKSGVYLFFVLSAYLLDRQIALFLINKDGRSNYWRRYFFRRFLRIYPLFAIALVVFGVATYWGLETQVTLDQDIPLHLLLLRGKLIFWSIPVEFKYYFISPLLLLFFHYGLKWNVKYIIWCVVALTVGTYALNFYTEFSQVSTLRYFSIFMIGMLIAVTEVLCEKKIDFSQYARGFNFLGLLLLGVYVLTIPSVTLALFGRELPIQNPIAYLPYALVWGGVLLSALHGRGLLRRFFELRFLRFFGVISYSLYLFHLVLLKYVESDYFEAPPSKSLVFFFFGSIAFSTFTYLLIEKPLSRIRLPKAASY